MWNREVLSSPSWREAEVSQHNGPAVTLGSCAWYEVLFCCYSLEVAPCDVKRLPGKQQPSQAAERPSGIFAGRHWGSDSLPALMQNRERGEQGESQREEGDFFPSQATKLGDPSFIVLGLQSDQLWPGVFGASPSQPMSLALGESNEWGRKTDKWEVVAWCWVWLRV